MAAFIDQLLANLNSGCIGVFGYSAVYQDPAGGDPVTINGILLDSGLNESTAPGFYCDFFVSVGAAPGNLPAPPVRYAHVTLNGVVYFVNDSKADKVGNGYHLMLHKDLP